MTGLLDALTTPGSWHDAILVGLAVFAYLQLMDAIERNGKR